MAFVLMKIFEESPRRFDRWMQIITLGRLGRIRDRILDLWVGPGAEVLEIGCGTGSLIQRLAEGGVRAVGIDVAEGMIERAQERLVAAGLTGQAEVRRLHALQIEDAFERGSFDRVVSVLALSEMTDDEIDCLLPQCHGVLRSGGRLILVDEVEPVSFLPRLLYRIYRATARLVTFLGLQAVSLQRANLFLKVLYFLIELPLMLLAFLVVPPLTHPLADLERRVERSGFRLLSAERSLGGSLQLLAAEVIP